MKLRIKRVSKKKGTFRVYLPKHVGEEYEGDAECLSNALTLTIIRPGISLKQAKKSLEVVLQDIDLRIEQEKNG